MSVTVITSVYGDFVTFFPRWWESVRALDPAPDRVIIAGPDLRWCRGSLDRLEIGVPCDRHPQPYLLQAAADVTDTEWLWSLDIDDIAMPDALAGLDQVDADVWQMGFKTSDGHEYVPPRLTNAEYLSEQGNPYVSGSAFRVVPFHAVGGFPDVAFQDWGLWRRLSISGARFESSGRAHFHYMRHPRTRSDRELTTDLRSKHLLEMYENEERWAGGIPV